MRKRPSFRRLSSDMRREEIIDAAINLFGHNAEHEVSIDDIATAASTSRTSVYRYFDSKQDLYHTAMRRLCSELMRRMVQEVPAAPSVQLTTCVRRYFDFIEEYEVAYAGLLQLGAPMASEETRALIQEVLEHIYHLAYQVLEVTDPTPALETTVHSWVAGVQLTGLEWLGSRRPDRAEVERMLANQLGVMLIAAASHDGIIAERIEWLLTVEPVDGPFAGHLRRIADVFSLKLLSGVTRLLAYDDAGAGTGAAEPGPLPVDRADVRGD
ncbi:TetR/AcrR family transcriptional regulator [Actinomadura scrupuli]|uniref:TetR/AcrR family transcriptional regulator n=1 Tax=Actinomadura scrupuli TaxID=559629 RepID=UPI003D990CCB